MTIKVGLDTAKTRTTLTAGNQSIAYYSIPAAQAAGLGDFIASGLGPLTLNFPGAEVGK